MKKIYEARDGVQANLLKSVLEDRGIRAVVQDARLQPLLGELPLIFPSVWVAEEDEERARGIATEFDSGGPESKQQSDMQDDSAEEGGARESKTQEEGSWTCPSCGERNGSHFSECWKCSGETSDERTSDEADETSSARVRLRVIAAVLIAMALLIASFFIISSTREGVNYQPVPPPVRVR